jgi:hypothetical protein
MLMVVVVVVVVVWWWVVILMVVVVVMMVVAATVLFHGKDRGIIQVCAPNLILPTTRASDMVVRNKQQIVSHTNISCDLYRFAVYVE